MKTSATPLVSVIIPAYNQGKLLARAIDGALGQTYEHKEIIVVNDGSPDSLTRDTAKQYGERIIYVERANGGLIALLDQDDVWLANKLERQVAVLRSHPNVGVVHSSYYLIDENGKRIG